MGHEKTKFTKYTITLDRNYLDSSQLYNASNEEIINPHNFKYNILETDTCSRSDPFLLIVVHTHPANYENRMVIRRTWGGHYKNSNITTIPILFMMGSINENPKLMRKVKEESLTYKDIIQENFQDTYRNLTHKAIMWLKWSSTYCANVRYLLKIDDDIFVNIFHLMTRLRYWHTVGVASEKSILCLVWNRMPVIRNIFNKWYLSRQEFAYNYFPRYCSGSAYILSGDVLRNFYEKALRTRFFWIDDFFVTGMLPMTLQDIQYHNMGPSMYVLNEREMMEKLVHGKAMFGHVPNSLSLRYELWKEILKLKSKD